jgi:hypothetical protein
MEKPNSRRVATRMDRTLVIVGAVELVEVGDSIRTWQAATRAAEEALASHKSSLISSNPLLLVELLMCSMQLNQSNTRLLHLFFSSSQ